MNPPPGSEASTVPPKASSALTREGLPLDPRRAGAAPAVVDAGDGGPARRARLRRPPPPLSAPSTPLPSKVPPEAPSPATRGPIPLAPGVNDGSLVDDDDDDDDDELVDYFGAGAAVARALPAAADAAPASSASPWNAQERNVRVLPSFYPLDRSAVFVPRASARILAGRIAAVLEALSIATEYDAENAKVDCVARSHVHFRVRLYRGRGEFGHGIIVEVQRRAGFDLSYPQDVFAILDAAEGKDVENCVPLFHAATEEGVMEFPTLRHDVLRPQIASNGICH